MIITNAIPSIRIYYFQWFSNTFLKYDELIRFWYTWDKILAIKQSHCVCSNAILQVHCYWRIGNMPAAYCGRTHISPRITINAECRPMWNLAKYTHSQLLIKIEGSGKMVGTLLFDPSFIHLIDLIALHINLP